MAFGWIYIFRRSKNTILPPTIHKICPRETDGKLLRYPCKLMMLSYFMVSMWAVSMHLQGAFDTFSDPTSVWIQFMNPPVKVVLLRKKRKPPD